MDQRQKEKLSALLDRIGLTEQAERVRNDQCPMCGVKVDVEKLKDEAAWREFKVSGLCQTCQDKAFEGKTGASHPFMPGSLKGGKDV